MKKIIMLLIVLSATSAMAQTIIIQPDPFKPCCDAPPTPPKICGPLGCD